MHPQATIHVLHNGEVASVLTFAQPLIRIGRVHEFRDGSGSGVNDIVLNAPRISSKHAHIIVAPNGLTVVDHSANGTFVNGAPIGAPHRLAPSELVEIDAYTLRCELTMSPRPEPGPTPPPSPTPAPRFDLVPDDEGLPDLDALPVVPPAPRTDPAPPPPAPPSRTSIPHPPAVRDTLAQLYRHLAAQFGAPAWGSPPPLDGAALPRVSEAVRGAVLGQSLPPGQWTDWLARELCGLGPLAAIIDDPSVTHVVVHGADRIDVSRGSQRETATSRFSCPEALHAVIERWSGARLQDSLDLRPSPDLHVHAWSAPLSAAGPLLVITRVRDAASPSLRDLVLEHTLPAAAADLLTSALRREQNILLHGGPGADLSALLLPLAAALPPGRSLCVLRRLATWPQGHAILLDGHSPAAWPCARRLAPDWLVVEELAPDDLPPLAALARHRGGGTLGTLRARSPDAALQRLAAMLAASLGGDLGASRQLAASCFDALVGLRLSASGRLHVDAITEVRPRGELAELFSWNPDISAVEPTPVEPQVLR